MALVDEQEIPPSLLDAYQDLLATLQHPGLNTDKVILQPSVHYPKQDNIPTARERFASYAAGWLRDTWLPNATAAERSAFFAARRAEVLAGTFPADWWATASLIEDKTEYCVPTVGAFKGDWDPAYNDPLRQQSSCVYRDATKVYNTPTPPGTESEPSPSWKGTVISSVWQDRYHAQRRVRFALTYPMIRKDPRPVGLRVDATISATATMRGNRNWFALIAQPYFHQTGTTFPLSKAAVARWAYEDGYPFELPGDSPGGWSLELTRTLIRAAQDKAKWYATSSLTRLTLRLSSPPSLGRYGSRNDDVSVFHTFTATVAQAKIP